MLEQVSNAVKFLAFFSAGKQGAENLAVTVDVYGPAGSLIVTADAATEIGGGVYSYVLPQELTSVVGEYVAVFKTTSSLVDQQHLPALWVLGRAGIEHLDMDVSDADDLDKQVPGAFASGTAGAALGRLLDAQIQVSGPAQQSGSDLLVFIGDDYSAADGRAWEFESATFPDLTGAAITARFRSVMDTLSAENTLPVFAGFSSSASRAVVEATALETGELVPGEYAYALEAELASGRTVTLLTGRAIAKRTP